MNDNAQKTLARIADVETNKADISTVSNISNEVTTLKGSVQTNTNEVNDLKQQIANLTSSLQQLQRQVDDTRTFKFEGNYNNQATYQKSSAVVSNNQLYISLIDNNRNPLTDTLSWLRLENFAPTADLNNFYTKVQIDTKLNDYLTRTTFNNEKNTFALKGSTNTFTANQVFNNQVKMGTFRWSPETNAIRFSPEADSKWLYFGNPSDNKYFGGIDLNDRVKLKGLPNPVSDGDAVNKRYLEEQLTLRTPPRTPMYLKGQGIVFANKAVFINDILPRLETQNGGRPNYSIWGDTSTPEAFCLGGKNLNNSQGNMPNGVQDTVGGDWRIRDSDLPTSTFHVRIYGGGGEKKLWFTSWWYNTNNNPNYTGEWYMGMSTYGSVVRERIGFWNPSYVGTEDVKDSYVGAGVWGGSNINGKRRYYDNMYVRLNTGSQTTMNIPRIAGFVVIVFSTDVYLKQTTTIEAQQLQEQNTIVEKPNETTIFVGETNEIR